MTRSAQPSVAPPVPRAWGSAAVAVVLLLVAAALTAARGAYGLPQNDDWAFSRVALTLHEHGEFRLIGAGRMMLIGHALWGQPFLAVLGNGVGALHTAGLSASVISVVAACALGARVTRSRQGAAFCAISVVGLPGFLPLSASYMTDVTAFAGQVMALALMAAALDRRGWRRTGLIFAAVGAAVCAFTSRQTALPALLAIGAAVVWAGLRQRAYRRLALETSLVLIGIGTEFAVYVWHNSLQNQDPIPAGRPSWANALQVISCLLTIGLGATPALAIWYARTRVGGRWGALCMVALWTVVRLTLDVGLVGNALTPYGSPYGVLAGNKARVVPWPLWDLLELLAVLGASGLTLAALTGLRSVWRAVRKRSLLLSAGSLDVLLVVYTALALGAAIAPAARGSSLFDRYLWPASLGLVLLLLRQARLSRNQTLTIARGPAIVARAALAVLIGTALLLVTESAAFASARWTAGSTAVAQGVPADRVDAGYEWTGWHAQLPVPATGRAADLGTSVAWWSMNYAPVVPCIVVSATRIGYPRYRLTSERKYTVLPGWQQDLYIQTRSGEGCP